MRLLQTAAALICAASLASANEAGLRITEMHMPHHEDTTRVAIWYPSVGEGTKTLYGDNPVFRGVEASADATLAPGKHPVVLFSHGMGGTDRAQAWLGAALAARGAIVVMVNHPYSTWGNFDMSKGIRHWTRALDLTAALDQLTADPAIGNHIDTSRIMAAGFSYGGWTALSMGGMTGNLEGVVRGCTEFRGKMEACDLFLSDKVNLPAQETQAWNASYADARISHVVAIDPGFVWGLDASNTADLLPDTTLIGFGSDETRMMATNFDASGLADLLPEAQVIQIDPSFHFTAMPLCKTAGAEILEAEEDDPVCTDPSGTDRAAVHDQIVDTIAEKLGL